MLDSHWVDFLTATYFLSAVVIYFLFVEVKCAHDPQQIVVTQIGKETYADESETCLDVVMVTYDLETTHLTLHVSVATEISLQKIFSTFAVGEVEIMNDVGI